MGQEQWSAKVYADKTMREQPETRSVQCEQLGMRARTQQAAQK